jgi:hypothetical protein
MVTENYSFNGDLSPDAEFAAIQLAHGVADWIERAGRPLSTDERGMVEDAFAPGFAHFYDLAGQAGQLAGEGDIMGAFSLMGGIDNARELIGDAEVDALFAELDGQPEDLTPDV